jgi:hypothetical protein
MSTSTTTENNNGSSMIATDTGGSSAVNENTAITSTNGYRQVRNTPWGKIITEEGYMTSQERFEDFQNARQAGNEQLAQERQQKKGQPEWPGRTVERLWKHQGISWQLQTFAMPSKQKIKELLSKHKYEIEHSAEYRSEFVKSLSEDRGDHYRGIMRALDEDLKINAAIRAEIQRFLDVIDDNEKQRLAQEIFTKMKDQLKQ